MNFNHKLYFKHFERYNSIPSELSSRVGSKPRLAVQDHFKTNAQAWQLQLESISSMSNKQIFCTNVVSAAFTTYM